MFAKIIILGTTEDRADVVAKAMTVATGQDWDICTGDRKTWEVYTYERGCMVEY